MGFGRKLGQKEFDNKRPIKEEKMEGGEFAD